MRKSTRLVAVSAVIAALMSPIAWGQDTPEVHVVHQHSDPLAAVARHMFRFEPPTLILEPGETVAFLNSVASHTVTTQKGLWPDGVEPVDIRGRSRAEVIFDVPGLYGITCARHGRYGMTMLIAVGGEGIAAAADLDPSILPATPLAKDSYAAQADALVAQSN